VGPSPRRGGGLGICLSWGQDGDRLGSKVCCVSGDDCKAAFWGRGRVRLPEGVADCDYGRRGGKTGIRPVTKFVASGGVIARQVFWGGGNAYVSRGAEHV
jgi:hypothetical protein